MASSEIGVVGPTETLFLREPTQGLIRAIGRDQHTGVNPGLWPRYRKTVTTAAQRIEGPFRVRTREGELCCEDGYLAIDSEGWPYPIAKDEFEAIYEPAI